ncbi:hypothetical protein Vadar_004225 [Vaccinium darrowii]|uniref:Uncharacterized protein n=1 Tax=Vaccinium darrowii TaxID=229202 RepID=A0ACB7YTA6_9ERIC|nr:hypothetical protein Vadar_004225 [Vaccinium darrowii]
MIKYLKRFILRLHSSLPYLQTSSSSSANSKMDWQGQKLAEQLMQILLVGFAVVAFATGYALGSFQTMLLVYAAGVVITTLVTVPNWPLFNRHPLNWLDPSEAEKHPKPQVANSSSKKKTTQPTRPAADEPGVLDPGFTIAMIYYINVLTSQDVENYVYPLEAVSIEKRLELMPSCFLVSNTKQQV